MSRVVAPSVIVLMLLAALPLQGCGQTGALYLPSDISETDVPAPGAEQTEDDADADNNSNRLPR